eukprot:3786417-Pyramimonas_sp.AAC.2
MGLAVTHSTLCVARTGAKSLSLASLRDAGLDFGASLDEPLCSNKPLPVAFSSRNSGHPPSYCRARVWLESNLSKRRARRRTGSLAGGMSGTSTPLSRAAKVGVLPEIHNDRQRLQPRNLPARNATKGTRLWRSLFHSPLHSLLYALHPKRIESLVGDVRI